MQKMKYASTKMIKLGSCCFRQPRAKSHCRFLHGYNLYAKFWFECSELDKNNWVVDFGGLRDVKDALRRMFDHTTVVASNDPMIDVFRRLGRDGVCDLRIMGDGVGIERFAKFCFVEVDRFIRTRTNNRCWLSKVEVFEHENNSAIYEEDK